MVSAKHLTFTQNFIRLWVNEQQLKYEIRVPV